MTLFSLRLLQHPVTRDFFAETVETCLPAFHEESLTGMEVTFDFEGNRVQEQLLLLPRGIVSGLFIGSVVGEPHSLISDSGWRHSKPPPSCRRFALDLEKQELLEVSWYLEKHWLLLNWVHDKFPTDSHCLSYFVVYEAPTPGKLPHKLYKSIEMISQFDKSDCSCSNSLDCYSLLQGNNFSTVCSVPEVKLFFQRITAPKSGVVRTTEYTKDGNNVAVDELARFSSHVRILRGLELAQSPLLHKTPTSQLPFIETENASEGIRQLLYSQQHLNTGEHDSMIGRNPVSQLQKRKHKLSKPQVVVDGKDFELDCELCKRSENASFQTSHIPSWTDNWNSLSSEENFSIVYNQQHPS